MTYLHPEAQDHIPDDLAQPGLDEQYLTDTLRQLLAIPSPSGYTEAISRFVVEELKRLGLEAKLTRRGAIVASLPGRITKHKRAVVSHLDTLGAAVTQLKSNGRLCVAPIGTWSSRFAEGARVTIFTDHGHQRGTIMPLKSSGHAYDKEIDTQPVSWDNVEVRIDDFSRNQDDLFVAGFRVGDFVAIDPQPEFRDNGYIVSRHLDDKAGVACVLTAAKQIMNGKIELPLECRLLFTIFEEVGSGAAGALRADVSEMISVDNGVNAPEQNSADCDVTIAMMDSSGPFDYHLTRRLLGLAREYGIPHARDVFRYYRSDAASAVESGNDIRTALMCFGVDGSHGYERTHLQSLRCLTELLMLYMQTDPVTPADETMLADLDAFPEQHTVAPPRIEKQAPDAVGVEDPKH